MIAQSVLVNSKNSSSSPPEKAFMNIKPKRTLTLTLKPALNTLLSACLLAASVSASTSAFALTGSADPAVTGATHIPQTVVIGQTSVLHTDFVNAGWDPIPVHSVSVSICGAASYYRSSGMTPPSGYGTYFTWTHLSTPPSTYLSTYPNTDCWVGTNNVVIPPHAGGTITLNYTGVSASPIAQITLVDLDIVSNPASFTYENTGNNEASATLAVVSPLPVKPPGDTRVPPKKPLRR